MIELVMIVCLASAPEDCQDIHLTYADEYATPMQCLMHGQPQIAQWIVEHPPIYTVKRWYCGSVGRRMKDI
jgi:hypothetical protein